MNSPTEDVKESLTIIKVIDYYLETCTICAAESECQNAFELSYEKLTAVDLFCFCTNIKIPPSDNPYYICLTCAAKLWNTYEFIKQCQESWYEQKCSSKVIESNSSATIKYGEINQISDKANLTNAEYKPVIEERQAVIVDEANSHSLFNDPVLQKIKDIKHEQQYDFEGGGRVRHTEGTETIEIIINEQISEENIPGMSHHETKGIEDENHLDTSQGMTVATESNLKNEEKSKEGVVINNYEKCVTKANSAHTHEAEHIGYEYQCSICQKGFNQECYLSKHMKSHNSEKSIICQYCSQTFETTTCLKKHQDRKHHNEVSTSYHLHVAPVASSQDSAEQIPTEHTEKDQLCNACGKIFNNEKSLQKHMRTHNNQQKLSCHICGKMFTSRDNLKLHIYIHMGVKPHLCKTCGKRFTQLQQLKAHLRIHTGEKPYICKFCSKSFTTSGTLVCHIRSVHTYTKPHVCHVCGKGYVQKPQLRYHLKSHEGQTCTNTFSCKLCLETFTSKGYLIVHKCTKTHLAPYICETCGKGFNQKTQFLIHTRLHTGERPYVCQVCSKGFRSQSILTVHTRKHSGSKPYVCDKCGKGFVQQQQLTSHMRVHTGEKPFKCEICLKTFSMKGTLTVHLRTHTGETPYVCDNCNSGFYAASSLKRHTLKCTAFTEVPNKEMNQSSFYNFSNK